MNEEKERRQKKVGERKEGVERGKKEGGEERTMWIEGWDQKEYNKQRRIIGLSKTKYIESEKDTMQSIMVYN